MIISSRARVRLSSSPIPGIGVCPVVLGDPEIAEMLGIPGAAVCPGELAAPEK